MIRTRRGLLALALAGALVLTACGGDDDGEGGADDTTTTTDADETTTTEGDGGGARDEYYDALVEQFGNDPENPLGPDEAECLADAILGVWSPERLEELGLTPDAIREGTDIEDAGERPTRDEAEQYVDASFECVDFGEAFIAGIPGVTDEQAQCFGDGLESSPEFRDSIVEGLVSEDAQGPSDEVLEAIATECGIGTGG